MLSPPVTRPTGLCHGRQVRPVTRHLSAVSKRCYWSKHHRDARSKRDHGCNRIPARVSLASSLNARGTSADPLNALPVGRIGRTGTMRVDRSRLAPPARFSRRQTMPPFQHHRDACAKAVGRQAIARIKAVTRGPIWLRTGPFYFQPALRLVTSHHVRYHRSPRMGALSRLEPSHFGSCCDLPVSRAQSRAQDHLAVSCPAQYVDQVRHYIHC